MRMVHPNASRFTRSAYQVAKFGDYIPFGMLTFAGLGGVITGFVLAITLNVFFVLLMLVGAPFAAVWYSYATNTRSLGSYGDGDPNVVKAEEYMKKLRGSHIEELAIPMANKIWQHAVEGGHSYFGRCSGACHERLTVMAKLVPAKDRVSDKSDIQIANQHLQMLKELGE